MHNIRSTKALGTTSTPDLRSSVIVASCHVYSVTSSHCMQRLLRPIPIQRQRTEKVPEDLLYHLHPLCELLTCLKSDGNFSRNIRKSRILLTSLLIRLELIVVKIAPGCQDSRQDRTQTVQAARARASRLVVPADDQDRRYRCRQGTLENRALSSGNRLASSETWPHLGVSF